MIEEKTYDLKYFRRDTTLRKLVAELMQDKIRRSAKDWYIDDREVNCKVHNTGGNNVALNCGVWKKKGSVAREEHYNAFASENKFHTLNSRKEWEKDIVEE